MRIQQAEFESSAVELGKCPDGELPEFAFIGRSNVGKSSLINLLTRKDGLARVSKTPGRTQEINFFKIDRRWRLVDLPGYGYAKVSLEQREKFNIFVSDYLAKREALKGVFVLIDARHPPQKLDLSFVHWVVDLGLPFCLVFTKCDKLKPNKVTTHIKKFTAEMRKWSDGVPVVFRTSTTTREGQREILSHIHQSLES